MIMILAFAVSLLFSISNGFVFWDPADEFHDLNTYFDNSEIEASFSALQNNYPNLVVVNSLGKTPGDNSIFEITITSNVSHWETAQKPSVKYVANMHGNEVRGRGLLLKLAYFLTHRYDTDPDVKAIVDSTIFHLLPTINPDGFERAAKGCTGVIGRYTTDGTDMNRDFPSHWSGGTRLKYSAETKMLMEYAETRPAVLGISYHDGALVANYPWDGVPDLPSGKYAASPDDGVFVNMARTYSLNHRTMTTSECRDSGFVDGTTNGNKWYKVFNGMQDWNYYYNDCFEITVELGCCKYPQDATSTFGDVWRDNFDSVFQYTKLAHYGINGRVTDFSGNPLTGVTIRVSGGGKNITVRHNMGYYWRPLIAGQYNISAHKQGYYPLARRNVVVVEGQSTEIDFVLIPRPQVSKRKQRLRKNKRSV